MKNVFDQLERRSHEQVVFCQDEITGLRAIVAIHDTTLGPALGGTRMWTYADDGAALTDALRLARGMTYKSAAAGLNLGGGKAVILGNSKTDKNEMLFRAFGRYVETLNGRYITAEDVGTDVNDMEYVYMETRYVTGVAPTRGGSGDPRLLARAVAHAGQARERIAVQVVTAGGALRRPLEVVPADEDEPALLGGRTLYHRHHHRAGGAVPALQVDAKALGPLDQIYRPLLLAGQRLREVQ